MAHAQTLSGSVSHILVREFVVFCLHCSAGVGKKWLFSISRNRCFACQCGNRRDLWRIDAAGDVDAESLQLASAAAAINGDYVADVTDVFCINAMVEAANDAVTCLVSIGAGVGAVGSGEGDFHRSPQ